jgi:pimeloyl-ACP methyl ester carboxylesterase
MHECRYVDARGVRAFVRVSERAGGLPVVLVHGLMISSLYMVPTARCLAPHVPVYAPDLPGFGLSGKPRRVLSVPAAVLAGPTMDRHARTAPRQIGRWLAVLAFLRGHAG